MTRRTIILISALALALVAGPVAAAPSGSGGPAELPPGRDGGSVDGSYIVVLDDSHPSSVAREHAVAHGINIRHVYRHAVQGYAARMSAQAVARISRDPRVLRIEEDGVEELLDGVAPTGVDRIEADRAHASLGGSATVDASDVHVAVLDTGISAHPDLNVAGGENFANGPSGRYDDKNGHGTHVAGTIGARGAATAGVAPGASLWALRVCNQACYHTDIVAGIDWMVQQKEQGSTDFVAANFSISSRDSSEGCSSDGQGVDIVHTAICSAVDAGIVFALAAGNDGRHKEPFPEALSVSAIADFDGLAGGDAARTCRTDTDDTLANFSNYGEDIDIAAPGVCITSTWNDGGYNTISGTSMATPHVTGAVALYVHANDDVGPGQGAGDVAAIETALLADAVDVGDPCGYAGRSVDDETVTGGPLLFLNGSAFAGDGDCGTAGPAEPVTDLAVTAVDVPASFDAGTDPDPVTVTVANDGSEPVDESVTLDLEVAADGDTAPALTGSISLSAADLPAPGASVPVTWDWDPTDLAVGDYTVTATLQIADDKPANDVGTATFTVVDPDGGGTSPGGDAEVTLRDVSWTAGPWWRVTVAVDVTRDDQPVSGATVGLTWTGGLSGDGTCLTEDGTCELELGRVRDATADDEVTITGVTVDGDPIEDFVGEPLTP